MTTSKSEDNTAAAEAPAGGIKSKLTDAQKAMLARKSGGGAAPGWQSTGGGQKPTHSSGKQAKAQKKVRW
ncbi:hypothetical protein [Arthrobacter cavernae]|uniref:Uncharacterized protein n=1 Tax=Arthrobacter cavernae TaxID=2817681 RepID=A0A939KPW2_9MICC|nr:hypothetical protein [Arthrobacter cavernae]MBO1269310.1 hypothetical protein [Arthrobacter cavernae]